MRMNHYKDPMIAVMSYSEGHRMLSGQNVMGTREYFQNKMSWESRRVQSTERPRTLAMNKYLKEYRTRCHHGWSVHRT